MQESPMRAVVKGALIAAMAVGSLLLWFGSPIGWLWIGSQMQTDSQAASLTPYAVVLAGIAVTAIALTRGLAGLNRAYARVTGQEAVRVRMAWLRGLRGEQEGRPPRTVLDVVMVISVSIGFVVLAIWFFFYAGSPLSGG